MAQEFWKSNFAFLMVMIGGAIGLGNIWRFPYVFYSNGQGSFLIPYFIAILVLGLPALLLENSIGVKYNDSILNIFKSFNKKRYQIIAWLIIFVTLIIALYYNVIVGWDLNYLFLSLTKGWGVDTSSFFVNDFLQSSYSINGLFNIVPYIFIAVLFIWVITWLISSKDLNRLSDFSTVCIPLLFFLGIGISIFNMTLPGAYLGIIKFFTPDWSLLFDYHIWLAAFSQILFSLSIFCGIILMYSSHLPKGTNIFKNALIIILANCGFEIIFAIGTFSGLGYMAYTSGISFDSLIVEGSGLAFIVFPQVFNLMGYFGYILGFLFFLCIFVAGISSSIALIQPLTDSLSDKFNINRFKSVTFICIIGFLISSIFTTSLGDSLIKVVDICLNNYILVFLAIVQCIIFSRLCDVDDLIRIININSRFKVGNLWKILIKYILPIILSFLLIKSILSSINFVTIISLLIISLLMMFFAIAFYLKK